MKIQQSQTHTNHFFHLLGHLLFVVLVFPFCSLVTKKLNFAITRLLVIVTLNVVCGSSFKSTLETLRIARQGGVAKTRGFDNCTHRNTFYALDSWKVCRQAIKTNIDLGTKSTLPVKWYAIKWHEPNIVNTCGLIYIQINWSCFIGIFLLTNPIFPIILGYLAMTCFVKCNGNSTGECAVGRCWCQVEKIGLASIEVSYGLLVVFFSYRSGSWNKCII